MTQAYRCDETGIENQNDSNFSLKKKRDAYLSRKKWRAFTRNVWSADGATKHGAALRITTRGAFCVANACELKTSSAI
jgi:hypothetical protein